MQYKITCRKRGSDSSVCMCLALMRTWVQSLPSHSPIHTHGKENDQMELKYSGYRKILNCVFVTGKCLNIKALRLKI